MKFPRYDWNTLSDRQQRKLLSRPATGSESVALRDKVRTIIDDVREHGDAALTRLTESLDGVRLTDFRVTSIEFSQAELALAFDQRQAIQQAIDNIRAFHEAQRPALVRVETMPGVVCERIAQPIDAVGLYVPAGSAPLPSAAMMLGIPAAIAGCPTRVLCSPPDADGNIHPAILFAARQAGISEVYKLGGAQAIAAMAYGTESVPKTFKVFGPGNAWVTEAKSQVAADPDGAAQDMPAGPSEVLVIADSHANPAYVAADLLSQAEHGPDSQVILLTDSEALIEHVIIEVRHQMAQLGRGEILSQALAHSALIKVDSIEHAVALSNDYAPEHLIINTRDARQRLASVRNAGSVFLGSLTPESLGDYCSGTNHVLPTYGFARNYSGLGVDQFLRYMTVQEVSPTGLANVGPIAETLAGIEGLGAHQLAVSLRLADL